MVPGFLLEIVEVLPRIVPLLVFVVPQVIAGLVALGFVVLYFVDKKRAGEIGDGFLQFFKRLMFGSLLGASAYLVYSYFLCPEYIQVFLEVLLSYRFLLMYLWLIVGIVASIAFLREK